MRQSPRRVRVVPPRVPRQTVLPILLESPRGFILLERVIADDGARTWTGRITWDEYVGWAVLLDPGQGD